MDDLKNAARVQQIWLASTKGRGHNILILIFELRRVGNAQAHNEQWEPVAPLAALDVLGGGCIPSAKLMVVVGGCRREHQQRKTLGDYQPRRGSRYRNVLHRRAPGTQELSARGLSR